MNSSMPLYENEVVPVPGNANNASWDNLPYFFNERNEGRYRWRERYNTPTKFQHNMKNYYRLATEVDTACGRIIEELERQGVMNETLVIFTTDNGNYHGEHQLADKWYAHEESIRVPLIVHDPRMPPSEAGIPQSDYTLNIDLAPTILSAAHIQPPDHMQGEDFSQLYRDPERTKSWRKEFYYEWQSRIFGPYHIPDVSALVRKDYKYIYWPQHKYEQLFHLPTDRLEENDLINVTDKQEIIADMKANFLHLRNAAR
jgi:arylsulfatase